MHTGSNNQANPAFDLFISHASEDKDGVVRGLAAELTRGGARVWYDELTLTLGDNLRRKIDEGLVNSRYGVVILSPHFFAKEWPQAELDALFAREMNGRKVILPIWHQISKEQVMHHSPLMAGRIAARTEAGIPEVAKQILAIIHQTRPPEEVPPAPLRSISDEPQPITELLQTIDVLAPILYGLDEPFQGDDAKAFMRGLQEFFHGWNHVNQGIDSRLRCAIDNLLRVILARGDLPYSRGKLATAAHCLEAYSKAVELHQLESQTTVNEVRMGMHELYCDVMLLLDERRGHPAADLLALRVLLPLANYGQGAWMAAQYPTVEPNIHQSLRELIEHLLPLHLHYAMPDRLDRIRNIDLQVSCQGQWDNLKSHDKNHLREALKAVWDSFRYRFRRPRAETVTASDLLK